METNRIDNAVPFMVFHPTEIIKDEIKARGMSQKELAERMGMKPSNVSRMFKEKENITPALAAKLENALGYRLLYLRVIGIGYIAIVHYYSLHSDRI